MSETMIERIAKAICMSKTCEGFMCCQHPAQMARRYTGCPVKMGGYDDAARAAIEAMRNPPDEVVQAMCEVAIDGPGYVDFYPSLNDCGRLFNAAINEILHGSALSQSPRPLPSEDR